LVTEQKYKLCHGSFPFFQARAAAVAAATTVRLISISLLMACSVPSDPVQFLLWTRETSQSGSKTTGLNKYILTDQQADVAVPAVCPYYITLRLFIVAKVKTAKRLNSV